jgi:hypothetical protein
VQTTRATPAARVPAIPRTPDAAGIRRKSLATVAPVEAVDEVRLPGVFWILVPLALGLLLVWALAAAPAHLLPRPVWAEIESRRELLTFGLLCGLAFGLFIVFLAILAVS